MAESSNLLALLPSLGGPRATSPEAIKRRRALAELLTQESLSPTGAGGSPLGAVGQGLKGLSGALMASKEDAAEATAQAKRSALYGALLSGGGDTPAGVAPGSVPALAGGGRPMTMPAEGASGPLHDGAKVVYDGLTKRGVPSIVAAGMVGNVAAESNFNPGIADDRGEGSIGLIQARGPRLATLKAMAAAQGKDFRDPEVQLDHIVHELNGSESKAYAIAQQAQTPGEAALALAKHYERPAAWALAQSGPKRAAIAEQAYRTFGAADMPAPGAGPVQYDAMGSYTGIPTTPEGFAIPPAAAAPPAATAPTSLPPVEVEPPNSLVPPEAEPTPLAPSKPVYGNPLPVTLDGTGSSPPVGAFAQPPMPPPRPADLGAPPVASGSGMPAAAPPIARPDQPQQAPMQQASPQQQIPPGYGLSGLPGAPMMVANPVGGGGAVDPRADMPAPGAQTAALGSPGAQDDGGNPLSFLRSVFGGGPTPPNGPLVAGLGGPPQVSPDMTRTAQLLNPQVAGQAPQQQRGGPNAQALMGILQDPYASPAEQQFALGILSKQMDNSVQHIDMGDSIGIIDKRGSLVGSLPKTKNADFGVTGKDPYGNEVYGFRNYSGQTVKNVSGQNGPVTDMNGQPIPQGVDPKIVRETQSKSYAGDTVPVDPKQVAEVRKEVLGLPSYKNLTQAMPVYRSMFDAAGRDTKAADLNLIYGLGKVMDPGSVVREGEMALANGTAGLDERLVGFAKSVFGGARLTPETRAALMAEAHSRVRSYEDVFDADSNHYRGIAKRGRMVAEDVVPTFEKAKPWEPAPKAAGAPSRADIEAEMQRRGLR